MTTKGLIAIDIDGTLTNVRDHLPVPVSTFLHDLNKKGWKILFVTGRTLRWSLELLNQLPFGYFLSCFNGAYTIVQPEGTCLKKRYLMYDQVMKIMSLMVDEDVGVVFYGPAEHEARPHLFSQYASHVLQTHLRKRSRALKERLKEVISLSELPVESFSAVRLFCLPHTAKKLSLDVEDKLHLNAPMMKDSYDDSFYVVQVTQSQVSKGEAMNAVKAHMGKCRFTIACGDDHNDISMLESADIAVVMTTAPSEVLKLADVIAPSAKENGIITGLKNAFLILEKQ
jgi:Cof subfamily protein (haloacid dehalogenase superfamily)